MKLLVLAILVFAVIGLLPLPRHSHLSQNKIHLTSLPTLIANNLPFDTHYYFNKVVQRKLNHLPNANSLSSIPVSVTLTNIGHEDYHLQINQQAISLAVSSYSGYVYGLQTLFQLIDSQDRLPTGFINDGPKLPHRGIMVDTVRHFISVNSLKKIIKTMPMAKLNIFHWHLFDNEAFPFQSSTNPQLQSAAYHKKSTYSREDIQDLITFAQQNAVEIIPEIQSPGHVRAWGENTKWKSQNITIHCNQLVSMVDVSKQKAYQLFANVTFEIDALFRKSNYIHMGGRQINESCWAHSSNIKNFMLLHNFKSYEQLQLYWQKQIRKNIGGARKVIYWRSLAPELTLEDQVVLQYNGNQSNIAALASKTKNKLILSPADVLDLSTAKGDYKGNKTGKKYITANQIYLNFTPFPQGVDRNRILGGQVTLWTDVSNENTLENDLWMRAAAFGERVWSEEVTDTVSFVERMVKLSKELEVAEVEPSPILSEYCQTYPQVCFETGKTYADEQLSGKRQFVVQ